MAPDPLRHHANHDHSTFGGGGFGQAAEAFARFFGTPKFIVGQTIVVVLWIAYNSVNALGMIPFDKYPFILLNLAFSTQAAYAAPLILLAQTRQADRDKSRTEADANHREELATAQQQLLEVNTELTKEVHALQLELHAALTNPDGRDT